MVFLKFSQNSQEIYSHQIHSHPELRPQDCNFIKKETLAQVFSCEFYEISKKTLLHRPPLVTASEFERPIRPDFIKFSAKTNIEYTFFFYKQSIFDPRPKNCLSFSKESPQKTV